ncbi:MAG: 50S ribosomal protein L10 [Acidobacteriota bacterium]
MKTRQQKESDIEVLQRDFQESPHALLVGFQGITVADDELLRRDLRTAGLTYRVVKNTLAIRAAQGTALEQVTDSFKGMTAVALSKNDPVTLAKVMSKWAKEKPIISFKAAVVEGKAMDVKNVEALSNMPSKEELISKMMFVINSGAQRLAVATAGVARNLTIVVDQIRAQKEGA